MSDVDWQAETLRLRAERDAARAALQPFVDQLDADGFYDDGEWGATDPDQWQMGPNVTLRMARAAREALRVTEQETPRIELTADSAPTTNPAGAATTARLTANGEQWTQGRVTEQETPMSATSDLATFGTLSHPPFGNYKSAEECADRAKHTNDPAGYLAWHAWAERKAKTHTQHQCPTCGFWVIWKRKRRAGGVR